MNAVPLLGHASLDDVLAWRPSGPVRVREFLADAASLAAQLPAGRNFLNLCHDRYRFTVGLAAGLISGRTSLQPAAQSADTLRQVRAACPDVFCLCDGDFDSGDLPRFDFPELIAVDPEKVVKIPEIPAARIAARLFTSGSTGLPLPHDKTWGGLARNGRAGARRLGMVARPHAIVATVPAQHSYGFESTVLLALHGNCPFWTGKPFYPQDIITALDAVPRPRMLVTTPFHLAALLAAGLDLPAVDLLLSATAPLSAQLAAEAERRFAAPLHEIYGCTEAGQIASRRTTADQAWRLLADVRLEQDGERTTAFGGHVEGRVVLSDSIEILGDGRFLLHGRHADLVNIAGKRSSLAYLNHQIAALPGVADAVFFLPDDETTDGIGRLCALVVAPGVARRQLLAALRERIDPAFLPRPLILVDALPRDATGKLPRERLLGLYASHKSDAVR
ncbi:MAG: acyl-CoA synthetase [Dechloromonas sp.]|nr:acyl-CoA synthetase [Candidatus Dechloromonas phosphoritropha]MBP6707525.1 acyl-CoA synthetase [Accumulibacter sp.]MBP8786606.1 acyl-CoA synthetase [Azonexus sp.]